jgi:hypothetical protein
MEMKPVFQTGQRIRQRSTERVGTIKHFDEEPTTGTRFHHVQFDGETAFTPVAESDLQLLPSEAL